MAVFSEITNGEIDPDSPFTTALATKYRDNPIASHKYVRRAAAGPTVTNSVVLVDDTVLEFAADASTAYAFKIVCKFLNAGGNVGVRTAIDVPAGATLSAGMFTIEDCATALMTAAENVAAYITTTDDDPGIFDTGGSVMTSPGILIEGFVLTVGAGTVKLRYACGINAPGNSVTIQAGSFLTYHRVDAI